MKSNLTGKVSVTIDAPASRVWEALTTPEVIKQYFFGTTTITTWKVGSPIVFEGEWQGKKYRDKGTILNFEPGKQLKYKYWSSLSGIEDKPENYQNVAYDLEEKGNSTVLTITQDNIPDEKTKEHSESNWKKVLDDLKNLLERKTAQAEK